MNQQENKWPFSKWDHLGVIVKDLDKAIQYYESLGMGPFTEVYLSGLKDKTMNGKPADFKLRIAKGQMGPVKLELIQPVKDAPLFEEFLRNKGEGINHIGFIVDDIDQETARLVNKGLKVVLSTRKVAGGGAAYFDMRKVGNVILELGQ